MIIFGYLFAALSGVIFVLAATARRKDYICFPKWLRISYLFMTGVFGLTTSRAFFDRQTTCGICFAIVTLLSLFVAAKINLFKIALLGDKFVLRTFLHSVEYGYEEISFARAEIAAGIRSIEIVVRRRKITLMKFMTNYSAFIDRLEENRVFERLPIVAYPFDSIFK